MEWFLRRYSSYWWDSDAKSEYTLQMAYINQICFPFNANQISIIRRHNGCLDMGSSPLLTHRGYTCTLPSATRHWFRSNLPRVYLPSRGRFPHCIAGWPCRFTYHTSTTAVRLTPHSPTSICIKICCRYRTRASYTRVTFPLCHEPFRSAHGSESNVSGIPTSSPYLIVWTRAISVSGERRTTRIRFSSVPYREQRLT